MATQSQAIVEQELELRLQRVESGQTDVEQAFQNVDDWIIELSGRRAFLSPDYRQWLWEDKLHKGEWVFAGCGIGEAILLTKEGVWAKKKLPRSGSVAEWCVYQQDEALQGPLKMDQLRRRIETKKTPRTVLVWSPQATHWLKIEDLDKDGFYFSKADSETILKVAAPKPKAKKS